MRRKLYYISGAVTGDVNFREKFNYAEKSLKKKGYAVLNPVRGEKEGKEWSYYMRKDIKKLLKCQGLILLPDFYRSKGALLEFRLARELGLELLMLRWDMKVVNFTDKGVKHDSK